MGDATQADIAERVAVDRLSEQISALGFATMQCLQGLPCNALGDSKGEVWRGRAEALGLAFHEYCRGICDQMQTENGHVDGGLHSTIFQLGAIGGYALKHLQALQIQVQGPEDSQRLFVAQAALAIQDACDSIAAQIGREVAA